jgi:hypothetical protein
MSNSINNNSNRFKKILNDNKKIEYYTQSQDRLTLGKLEKICALNNCAKIKQNCVNNAKNEEYVMKQQNLYAEMRRFPERFPLIQSSYGFNSLNYADQRRASNLWYRQFGTSQALPVNDNWGGFYVVGSEVPYTN